MSEKPKVEIVTRRDFVAGAAMGGALAAAGAQSAFAAPPKRKPPTGPAARPAAKPAPRPAAAPPKPAAPPPSPVHCAVIGCGVQGREILAKLGSMPGAVVAAVCDTYEPFLKRGQQAAPKAAAIADYRAVLERSDVAAVILATPTHLHKEIALAAIQAGKALYCEAPIAHTVEDARAIALAAHGSKQPFQGGLQNRANPQHLHVRNFMWAGTLGSPVLSRAQWHKKTSWRKMAPSPERERVVNWRLDRALSTGLAGEEGIHSLDTAGWFLKLAPVSVSGYGSVLHWKDGRQVADTIHCVVEYPGGVRLVYDASLANSFEGTYEVIGGTEGSVLLRGQNAWLFKESDAPLQGWEVYTRKEQFTGSGEYGIALVADASKILALGKIPGKDGSLLDPGKTALYYALESFLDRVRKKELKTVCGPEEALRATVTALKANEAVMGGTEIAYQKQWFELG